MGRSTRYVRHIPFNSDESDLFGCFFSGDMEIIGKGNAEGLKCHLKFIPYSYFGRDSQRRVKGVVMDAQNNVKWAIDGESHL